MPTFTRANLKSRINAGIKGKIGMLLSEDDLVNDVVREVISDVRLRSQKRKSRMAPNLFSTIYEYGAPVDLDDQSIVDIAPQVGRRVWSDWRLTTPEEFDRRKSVEDRIVAVNDHDNIKKILIGKVIDDDSLSISTLDTVTSGGGTWVVTGGATNLVANSDDYVKGSASLMYDISASAVTTAGIKNTGLNTFDFTDYKNNSVFHWQYIQSTTGLTSYTMNIGSSTSNYYSKTVTTNNEGTAFVTGWNLLRFDFTAATTTGTPLLTAFNYVEIYMNKLTTKVSETGYRADNVEAKKGQIYDLYYYSEYGWETSSGTWIVNSTDDSDILHADPSEFNMFIQKGVELAGIECEEDKASERAAAKYEIMKNNYGMQNPDESLILQTTYYDFGKQDDQYNILNN